MMETSAAPASAERRPHSPPLWFYLVMIFLFAWPALGVGLRLLQGQSAFGPEDHHESCFAYTPFALALVACLGIMRRDRARGTRFAAWTIALGIALFLFRFLLPAINEIPSSKDPIWEGFFWVVCFGVSIAMALFAWRTAQAWRT